MPLALVGLASVFVALALYTTLSNQSGRYAPDARLEQVVAPGQNLARSAYLWDDARSLGKPLSHFFYSPASTGFQAVLDTIGVQPWLIGRLTHALYLSLAAIGVIVLMREFRPRLDLATAIAAFVYTFSPFTSQFLLPSPNFLYYALAPWFAWMTLRGVRDDDAWRWAAAFALTAAASGAPNIPALGFALIPAALIALYLSLYERHGLELLRRWIWRTGLLTMLTCAASIVVLWFSGPEVGENLRTTELPQDVARTSSWAESWRGLGFWLTYLRDSNGELVRSEATAYFMAPGVIAASFLAPLGALVALGLGRWRHRLLFGAMLLISLMLMVGIHESGGPSPFGWLLYFAFDHSGFALGFRNTFKAGAGLMLAISVLLGMGIAAAVSAGARGSGNERPPPRLRALRPLVLSFIVPLVVAMGVLIASFPFWTDRLYPDNGFRTIPPYWDRAFGYLGQQEQPGRVLVLPGAENAHYRWGDVHDSLFDGLSPLSPLINRVLPQGTAESADLVASIDEYLSSNGYVKGTLGPILRRLGVQWVVLQNDLDWQRMGQPRPYTYAGLRVDPGLRRVATFGRPGENTSSPGDADADLLGERALPPVEVYRVAGAPSPRPRLVGGPPLLVSGGGDSWPSLASAGLLEGPPVAYTGAAQDNVLREMVASGSQVVVTDGNRRRLTHAGVERPSISPTLALGEPQDRTPTDLFGSPDTQSITTYADAAWISASRYGFPLTPYEASARPANAFDGVERTAWTVRGALHPDGESIIAKLSKPVTVAGISVLPHSDGPWRVREVDVIFHSEDRREIRTQLRFEGASLKPAWAGVEATEINEIELRIAKVDGPGPVGLAGVGVAEVGVATPDGALDLRGFVRTPDDLAIRAAADHELDAMLAEHPPRYELRRMIGIPPEEETELRREITTFGNHRYRLNATARVDNRSGDSAIDGLLGAAVGAVSTSRFDGNPIETGNFLVDDDLTTGWEPIPRKGERVDLRFPTTEVQTVEVLVVSGPPHDVRRSRVTSVGVTVGKNPTSSARSTLPRKRQCESGSPLGGCLETHVLHMTPTKADRLSVRLTGIKRVIEPLGARPPRVVEVRLNGGDWSALSNPAPPGACAPLFAVDGDPVSVRLPGDPSDVLGSTLLTLHGCEPIRLGPGRHRIESRPGLSGAVLTTSLLPLGEKPVSRPTRPSDGNVELVDHSPTQLDLRVRAPKGALLIGGMPWHSGWVADGGELHRFPVPLDTFSTWTVGAPTNRRVTLRFTPQTTYELAMALSIAAAAWCLWRVTRRRRTQ